MYFVRTNYNKAEGDPAVPDKLWREAVQKTGGKFFAASDERTLLAAINEIDQVAAGTIQLTSTVPALPALRRFAAVAALCFALGTGRSSPFPTSSASPKRRRPPVRALGFRRWAMGDGQATLPLCEQSACPASAGFGAPAGRPLERAE